MTDGRTMPTAAEIVAELEAAAVRGAGPTKSEIAAPYFAETLIRTFAGQQVA